MIKNSDNYNDIINIPYKKTTRRNRMTNIERAAQFSSFAALVGYEEAVEETARQTENQMDLSDNTMEYLNRKLQILSDNLACAPKINVRFFVPDEKKDGGEYKILMGAVKKIDDYNSELVMGDGTHIPIYSITEIEGQIFEGIDF